MYNYNNKFCCIHLIHVDVRNRPLSSEQLNNIIIAVSVTVGVFVILAFILGIVILVVSRKCFIKNKILKRAIALVPQPTTNDPEVATEQILKNVIALYRGLLREVDSTAQPTEDSELTLSDEEVRDTVDDIIKIMRAGLNNSQLKQLLLEKIEGIVPQIVRENDQFLIDIFKRYYITLYEDVTANEISQQELEKLAIFF